MITKVTLIALARVIAYGVVTFDVVSDVAEKVKSVFGKSKIAEAVSEVKEAVEENIVEPIKEAAQNLEEKATKASKKSSK